MNGFDPNRVLEMARVLDKGSDAEKLALLEALDPKDPISSGILMRAAADGAVDVRVRALERMAEAGIRPVDAHLARLLEDDDERVRALAEQLQASPDALNPLEQLIPQVEQMASSLGPLGGLLRTMIESLRGMGSDNEREQLHTLARLDPTNPIAALTVQQALQSSHLSVRLLGLKKALQVEGVMIPEAVITEFLTDPSDDIRQAATAVVAAGRVGTQDEEAVRAAVMQSMMKGMFGGAMGGGAGGGPGGLDLGALFSSFAGGDDEADEVEAYTADAKPIHAVDGWIYFVGDERLRDRLRASLRRQAGGEAELAVERLEHGGSPERWAIRPAGGAASKRPGWAGRLEEAGLSAAAERLAPAEQACALSQQVWGVAWAEHAGDTPLTLVFHDGTLSRAEWGGRQPGSWSAREGAAPPGAGGPLGLLVAFLDDPTDERLAADKPAKPLHRAL